MIELQEVLGDGREGGYISSSSPVRSRRPGVARVLISIENITQSRTSMERLVKKCRDRGDELKQVYYSVDRNRRKDESRSHLRLDKAGYKMRLEYIV